MKIHVKQSHIKRGVATACDGCPIALAVREIIPEAGVSELYVMDKKGVRDLPRSAQRFIKRFDAGKKVKPFNFILR